MNAHDSATQAWVERVKSTVPKEKLLVFDVKDRWDLCFCHGRWLVCRWYDATMVFTQKFEGRSIFSVYVHMYACKCVYMCICVLGPGGAGRPGCLTHCADDANCADDAPWT